MGKERTASALGRMGRRKGRAFEQEIARLLRQLWPEARRGLGQPRAAGEVPDVDGTPYWLELKHSKRAPRVHAAHAQARAASTSKTRGKTVDLRHAVVISRENNGPTLVTMTAEVWLELERLAAKGRVTEKLEALDASFAQ